MTDSIDPLDTSPQTDINQEEESIRFPTSASIQARVIFGEVTYYALTSRQIDNYVSLGRMKTVCLTLAGIFLEAAFGCWLAIEQGVLSPANSCTINIVKWVTLVVGMIIAVFAGILWWFRDKDKRGWLTNTIRL